MAAEDIDGLYPESVRIHLSRGSFDVSSRWWCVELLPPCYRLPPPSLHCPSLSFSICLSLSMHLLSERVGGEGEEHLNSLQNLSSTQSNSNMTPPRLSCTVSKVSVGCLHKPLDLWWNHFSKDSLDSTCFWLNIYRLTGLKLRVSHKHIHGRDDNYEVKILWYTGTLFSETTRKKPLHIHN